MQRYIHSSILQHIEIVFVLIKVAYFPGERKLNGRNLAASGVKAKLKIDFPVPGLVVVNFLLVDGDDGFADGFVVGGLVVGGLGSTIQIRNTVTLLQ